MKKQDVYLHHGEYESKVFEEGSDAYEKALANGWSEERVGTAEDKVEAPEDQEQTTKHTEPTAQKPYDITSATDEEVFSEAERRGAVVIIDTDEAANPILPAEEAVSLTELTVAQLKVIAGEAGIAGYKSMKHAELVDAILAAEDGTDAK